MPRYLLSAEGAPRFVPALRASGASDRIRSPPSQTGLLTASPSDLTDALPKKISFKCQAWLPPACNRIRQHAISGRDKHQSQCFIRYESFIQVAKSDLALCLTSMDVHSRKTVSVASF